MRGHLQDATLGFLGSERVNVLRLNIALDGAAIAVSLRARTVTAMRRRLPELDEEAAWRGALAAAASLFLLLVAIAILVPLRDDFDTGSIALVLLLPPLVASNGGRTLSIAAR